jgi:nitrogen fixation protein NifU and related proteins
MADLRDLYQEAVLDHYRNPRNFQKPDRSNRQADGFNPFCGDKITIFIQIEEGIIKDIGFTGSGCAISISSASMMTESLKEKTEAEARELFGRFRCLITDPMESQANTSTMGDLAIFSGIREYPVRAKCAALAWHAMIAALQRQQEIASTE